MCFTRQDPVRIRLFLAEPISCSEIVKPSIICWSLALHDFSPKDHISDPADLYPPHDSKAHLTFGVGMFSGATRWMSLAYQLPRGLAKDDL